MTEPAKPKTIVYVDGFNLYYRRLKDTPYKWLDLYKLFTLALPKNDVVAVKYYTANVSAHIDPAAPLRQQIYLDALETLEPLVQIIKGNFMSSPKFMPVILNAKGEPEFRPVATASAVTPTPTLVRVMKTEEKGSDVNLGAHLVFDACQGACDVSVVVTNDTDLVEPIRLVRHELGRVVGLVTTASKPHTSLAAEASFIRHIHTGDLVAAQFPGTLLGKNGATLVKPIGW